MLEREWKKDDRRVKNNRQMKDEKNAEFIELVLRAVASNWGTQGTCRCLILARTQVHSRFDAPPYLVKNTHTPVL